MRSVDMFDVRLDESETLKQIPKRVGSLTELKKCLKHESFHFLRKNNHQQACWLIPTGQSQKSRQSSRSTSFLEDLQDVRHSHVSGV